jgi:hypothetical protein
MLMDLLGFWAGSRINDTGVESSLSGTIPSGHSDENSMEIASEVIGAVERMSCIFCEPRPD